MDRKFIVGLTAGLVIGFGVAGLQPLRAANEQGMSTAALEKQLGALLKEMKTTQENGTTIRKELEKIAKTVDKMAGDVHVMAGRSDITPTTPKPNY